MTTCRSTLPRREEEKEAEEAAFVPDGTVDEAVEAAEPAAEQPETTEPEKDESEEVPTNNAL